MKAENKLKIMKSFQEKIEFEVCQSQRLCIKALDVCMIKGYLPKKFKGHRVSWTLQNPYLTMVPKSGILVRVL